MHKKIRPYITLLFVLLAFEASSGQVDNKSPELKYWAQGGMGVSAIKFTNSDVALSWAGGVTFDYNSNLFSLKYHNESELSLFNDPSEIFWSAELLYGRRVDFVMNQWTLFWGVTDINYSFTYSLGVGLVGGSRRKDLISRDLFDNRYTSEKISTTIGIPIDIELTRKFTDNIGLGLGLYSNINREKMFYGARFNISIGVF